MIDEGIDPFAGMEGQAVDYMLSNDREVTAYVVSVHDGFSGEMDLSLIANADRPDFHEVKWSNRALPHTWHEHKREATR